VPSCVVRSSLPARGFVVRVGWGALFLFVQGCGAVVATGTDSATEGGTDAQVPDVVDGASDRDALGIDAIMVETGPDVMDAMDAMDASDATVGPEAGPDASDGAETGASRCGQPADPPPQCSNATCGNGRIDTCQRCTGGPPFLDGGCTTVPAEECDGTLPTSTTCAGLGYAGGNISCGSWCGIDTSQCNPCATTGGLRCQRAPIDAIAPGHLAVAVRGGEIGVLWSEGRNNIDAGLRFARFSANLTLLSRSFCLPVFSPGQLSLAATSAGWIVAAEDNGGIVQQVTVFTLDPTGVSAGQPNVVSGGSGPRLFSGSRDITLLTTRAPGGGLSGAFVQPNGALGTATTLFSGEITSPEFTSAVHTGDGFLVATRERNAIAVRRVEDTGSLGTVQYPVGQNTEYPNLAWNGSEILLTYGDFGSTTGVRWQRLDRLGAPQGTAVLLGNLPTLFNPTPFYVRGTESVVLYPGYTGTTARARALSVGRLSANGTPLGAQSAISQDPGPIMDYGIAPLGSTSLIYWRQEARSGGIVLATFTP